MNKLDKAIAVVKTDTSLSEGEKELFIEDFKKAYNSRVANDYMVSILNQYASFYKG